MGRIRSDSEEAQVLWREISCLKKEIKRKRQGSERTARVFKEHKCKCDTEREERCGLIRYDVAKGAVILPVLLWTWLNLIVSSE